MSIFKQVLVITGIINLWGCSNIQPDTVDALNTLESDLQQQHQSLARLKLDLTEQKRLERVEELLGDALYPAQVMELLLINSPKVRADLAGMGIAEAARLQAGLISNPTLAFGALRPEGGGRWQLDAGLSQSLLDVFTRPLRRHLAEAEFTATQLELHVNFNNQLYDVQQHYYQALAARQRVQLQQALFESAQASYSLARSLFDAGNIPERSLLQFNLAVQHQERQVRKARVRAQQQAFELAGVLGLNSGTELRLPTSLPALPAEDNFTSDHLSHLALNQRNDIQLARAQLSTAEQNLSLQRKTGRFTEMELGANVERETDGSYMAGPEIALSLPLFDRGDVRRFGASAEVAQAREMLKAKEIDIEAEIDSALLALENERHSVEQIDKQSLPLLRKVQALQLREYNFMLGSAFELIELKQQEFELQNQQVDALLNYWLARSALALASGTSLLPAANAEQNLFEETVQPEAAESQVDHSQHIDHSVHHHGGHHD